MSIALAPQDVLEPELLSPRQTVQVHFVTSCVCDLAVCEP